MKKRNLHELQHSVKAMSGRRSEISYALPGFVWALLVITGSGDIGTNLGNGTTSSTSSTTMIEEDMKVTRRDKASVNICCPEGTKLNETFSNFCEEVSSGDKIWNITYEIYLKREFKINYIIPCSSEQNEPFCYDFDEYNLTLNGKVYVGNQVIVNDLCYDSYTGQMIVCDTGNDEEEVTETGTETGHKVKTISLTARIIYMIGVIISLICLLLTFIVYITIPELQNIHGKCLMCLISTYFVTYFFILITNVAGYIPAPHCQNIAFVIYFSFLASFFWLNVMCLDIWWTFSGFRPLQGSVKEREHKKFIIYSLYCWGSPLIMLIIAMTMDLHPDIPDSYLKPRFGKYKCWFETEEATLWYFLGPIAVLILSNIILFIATAIKIRKLKNETKILEMKGSKRHEVDESNAQRFNLYLKLFLVMGVNWIMEVISWACGGPEYLWYVTDIGNTLQGVLIFIIFVWKDRIRRLLMERFCPKRSMSSSTRSALTTTRSITSTGPNTRNSTLTNKASVRSTNLEEYRMKPLMENSCMESEVP